MTGSGNDTVYNNTLYDNIDRLFHAWQGRLTAGVSPKAALPCPSVIGYVSGVCQAGSTGGRACNGRRDEAN
jgi:hypothetical protein